MADTLGAILEERARAGVPVYALFDAFGWNLPRPYIERLRGAGAHVLLFRPLRFKNLWVVQNRSHIRGIVVDGRVAWTGGFGIDDKWLGSGRRLGEWRETNVRFAARARCEQLLEAGVRVYEYAVSTLHAKTFFIDGLWISVGTMNFDNRSIALNDESTLMMLDSTAGRRMEDVLRDDLRHAREIDFATFRRRSWIERVAERGADKLTRVL